MWNSFFAFHLSCLGHFSIFSPSFSLPFRFFPQYFSSFPFCPHFAFTLFLSHVTHPFILLTPPHVSPSLPSLNLSNTQTPHTQNQTPSPLHSRSLSPSSSPSPLLHALTLHFPYGQLQPRSDLSPCKPSPTERSALTTVSVFSFSSLRFGCCIWEILKSLSLPLLRFCLE